MKTTLATPQTRLLVIAVQTALVLAAASGRTAFGAEGAEAARELTQPQSSIELGATHVDQDSAKFGEYNGLDKKGTTAIGNLDVEGGSAYDSPGVTRYRVLGKDLGTEVRSLDGAYGEQGVFRFDAGYDELRRNRSDTYRTPLLGVGGNLLTLPSSWKVPVVPCASATAQNARGLSPDVTSADCLVGGHLKVPSAAQLGTAASIRAADLPLFREVELYTRRQTEHADFSAVANPNLDFSASISHQKKDGYKPMAAVSRMFSELSTILPDPIQQTHDQYTAAVNYHRPGDTLGLEYYGSRFTNDIASVSWQTWGTAAPGSGINTISSPPSNDFHQLSLTGSHDFLPGTHLVASAAYGRNTQNAPFVTDPTDVVVPAASLSGEVINKSFYLRLSSQVRHDLGLGATWHYDLRDNRTPVLTYQFSDAQDKPAANPLFTGTGNSAGAPAVLAENANANTPYSRRTEGFSLDGDYHLGPGQAIKAGWDTQLTERWCNGSWISCTEAAKTRDNTLRVEWHSNLLEDLSGRVGYAYSMRRVGAYNENAFLAYVPYADVRPNGATQSAWQYMLAHGLNGYGPTAGYAVTTGDANIFFKNNNALNNNAYANNNRISELPGLREYNMADRNRDRLKTGLDWQASEQWDWQGSFEYTNDDYFNTTYGLKQGSGWALNLEGSYAAGETFSTAVYASHEEQRQQTAGNSYTANSNATNVGGFTAISGGCFATVAQRNLSNKIDPCLNWTSDMRDGMDTIGASFRKSGLLQDRLQLIGELSFSRARTENHAVGGNYVNNPLAVAGAPAGTVAVFYVPASDLPTVTSDILQLHLGGSYQISKASSMNLGLGFYRMRSNDYSYQGLQPGGLTGILPDFEQSPNYTIHSIAASYSYRFE